MFDNKKPTESHSALFGLDGQKRPSAPGAGAGSGIIGTTGHAGAANRSSSYDAQGMKDGDSTIAATPQGAGKTRTLPGSGSETLTPSQGSGEIKRHG